MDKSLIKAFCKECKHKDVDETFKLMCGVTSAYPAFDGRCKDFDEKSSRAGAPFGAQYQPTSTSESGDTMTIEPFHKNVSSEFSPVFSKGVNYFLWIGLLSILNSFLYFIGLPIAFLFGLGYTQVFEVIYSNGAADLSFMGFILSSILSSLFIVIWKFAKERNKLAFMFGMGFYALDTLLVIIAGDYVAIGVHGVVLFLIVKSYLLTRYDL